ncbi:extracellular solute-binding protein [Mollicutes bacterium LVI A0078]|nr:extracellular solute-binding protein [Mollicutes bacterium LVI A0075]WOO91453.1 extracellular solute-binding protein [Mollicutes bacterium LVI A0078]
MKKLLGLISVFVLLLAGCGSSSSSDKVVVWAMGEEGNRLHTLTEEYTADTGVEVEVVAIPWDQAYEKLSTAVASKSGPDVIQMGTSWIPEFGNAGALADLSEFADGRESFDKDLYFEGSQDTMFVNDKFVSVPWYVDTRVLYYRTDIVSDVCGLDTAPQTWDEMLDCSEKLSARGDDQYSVDLDIKDQFFFVQYAWQNGWVALDENGKVNVTDEKFVEAVDYVRQFAETGATEFDLGLDITQTFADGSFPMFISGPWMVNVINEANPDLVGKYEIAQLPAGDEGSTSLMGGSNLVIFEYSENKEGAADLINWLTTPEVEKEWYEIAASLPSNVNVWDDAEFIESGFMLDVWKDALEDATGSPMIAEWEKIAQEIVSAQEQVMVEGKDTDTVIEELQTKIDALQA